MRKEELIPMDSSVFYEGMYIGGGVYFQYEKSYVLLCKDVTLTAALLAKFYQTEWASTHLFVEKDHVDDILALSAQFKELNNENVPVVATPPEDSALISNMMELTAKVNLQKDYQEIMTRLDSVLDVVKTEHRVPMEISEALKDEINTKLELTDPAFLIECINTFRPPDVYLSAHAANVGMLNGMIGTWLKMPQDELNALIKTGLLHDVGKLSVPDEILNKPGPLTAEEFAEMKKHPIYSYEILKLSKETDQRILEGVLSHHEKLNGTGYPNGLQVTQISLFSRITAVSDVYDAMVAKRAYKDRHSPFEILAEFAFHKFSDLDIGIVNVFLDKMPSALLGKNVLLSDGRTGKVSYINSLDFEFPIVEIEGKLISTSPVLRCVAMENFLAAID